MRRVRVEPTVSIGDVISLITLLVALAAGFSSVRERIGTLEAKVEPMWRSFVGGTVHAKDAR